jgi:hypothetical protein
MLIGSFKVLSLSAMKMAKIELESCIGATTIEMAKNKPLKISSLFLEILKGVS